MNDSWLVFVTFCTALGCGLMAGVFFAFSTFVMPAFARLPPVQGIAAMQSINVAAITPAFMVGLFGTAAACIVLALASVVMWQRPGTAYLLAGSLLYLVGTIVVTILFNVPRNDALAAISSASVDGARVWADYVTTWTAWNHVRAVAALAAATALTIGFCLARA